jgi:subtilase family serine protease
MYRAMFLVAWAGMMMGIAQASLIPGFIEMDTKLSVNMRSDYAKRGRALGYLSHEVMIAIQQQNLAVLEGEVLRRSTPNHPDFRRWMTRDEVEGLRRNDAGSQEVVEWLASNGVNITWSSASQTYLRASTSITRWEELLQTTFHMYENLESDRFRLIPRAESYHLPESIRAHVHALFDVSELPPRVSRHAMRRDAAVEVDTVSWQSHAKGPVKGRGNLRAGGDARRQLTSSPCEGYSNPNCLDYIYNVASNTGSAQATQAVFEMIGVGFSPSDLADFQNDIGAPNQPALSVGGYNVSVCATDDDLGVNGTADCGEGNLDIQYIMGMAQATTSTFYYVDSENTNEMVSIGLYCCAVRWGAVLCCAVLCCAVLCCAVLCCYVSHTESYAVTCVVLWCVLFCFVVHM